MLFLLCWCDLLKRFNFRAQIGRLCPAPNRELGRTLKIRSSPRLGSAAVWGTVLLGIQIETSACWLPSIAISEGFDETDAAQKLFRDESSKPESLLIRRLGIPH